jgi:hypothetical protein
MSDDSTHWRQRAQETRKKADKIDDPLAKDTMLAIADACEQLADRLEERDKPKTH